MPWKSRYTCVSMLMSTVARSQIFHAKMLYHGKFNFMADDLAVLL